MNQEQAQRGPVLSLSRSIIHFDNAIAYLERSDEEPQALNAVVFPQSPVDPSVRSFGGDTFFITVPGFLEYIGNMRSKHSWTVGKLVYIESTYATGEIMEMNFAEEVCHMHSGRYPVAESIPFDEIIILEERVLSEAARHNAIHSALITSWRSLARETDQWKAEVAYERGN